MYFFSLAPHLGKQRVMYLSFIMQMKCLNVELKFCFFSDESSFFSLSFKKYYFPTWYQDPTKCTCKTPKWYYLHHFLCWGEIQTLFLNFCSQNLTLFFLKLWIARRPLYVQVYSLRNYKTSFHILQVCYIAHTELICIFYAL